MVEHTFEEELEMILRGQTAFLVIKEIGELDSKGRKVVAIGYSGKRTAREDIPLSSLVVPLMNDLLPHISYENSEQFLEDMRVLRKYLDGLNYVE